jgi:hypothetical protein
MSVGSKVLAKPPGLAGQTYGDVCSLDLAMNSAVWTLPSFRFSPHLTATAISFGFRGLAEACNLPHPGAADPINSYCSYLGQQDSTASSLQEFHSQLGRDQGHLVPVERARAMALSASGAMMAYPLALGWTPSGLRSDRRAPSLSTIAS